MNKMMKSLLPLAIGATLSTQAWSQDFDLILEEVVVTAQKRVERLQDVPISVNAVSGAKMDEAGITNLEGMTAYVPNLTMNQTGIGTIIAIRGISSGINQGFEQSVGQYVDGVYYGRSQLARAPFMDLERVEVLRGPQSILFGKNSIAGAISMVTAKPTEEFEGQVTALYEPSHGEKDVRVVVSGPLTDSLRGRLSVLGRDIDGYYENTTLNRDESAEEEHVIRGQLSWDASDDLSMNLKIESGSFNTQGRFLEPINPIETTGGLPYATALLATTGGAFVLDTDQDFKRQSNGDSSENDTKNATLTIDYALGDHTLTAVTGYNAYNYEEICDCDFTGATIFTADSREDFNQYSQEIRIASPQGETIDYIGGLFYQSSDMTFDDAIRVPATSVLGVLSTSLLGTASQRDFTQDSTLWAGFAQATWNIDTDWRLTVGGRYTSEDKTATRTQHHTNSLGADVGSSDALLNTVFTAFLIEPYSEIKDKRSEAAFTPLVTLQWDATEDMMVYATYTEGFKAGGFDVRSNAHPDPAYGVNIIANPSPLVIIQTSNTYGFAPGVFEYEEEKATSFELGSKMTLADGAAELNVALFHTNYTDLQTSQFDGKLGFNVTNAGEATTQGIELDGRWLVAEGLTLSGSVGMLDFQFDSFPNSQCYFGQTPNSTDYPGLCDLSGKTREFAPEYQGTLSADYNRALGDDMEWRVTGDINFSDSYFTSPTLDPNLEQDAYAKLNLRFAVGSADGDWEVALVGKNLTDEKVATFGNQLPVSTALTSGTGTAYYSFFDRPRSIALQGTMRF
ncbi:TonB-dependent receptor [Simiduia aestuariiviva]|uniref:Outer membrane receptor protein involved in Fe transport n=1 Tax=Simiduia aestuariiviva TaxID=1510459 RepID=A0A839UN16_9GAMM|nr:TonB-dependent receptor [Simiduia aestuariiviva]MBB3169113.1 outer membrane receptor protein involved in Fe transport [Simiduia aestuariiviva]